MKNSIFDTRRILKENGHKKYLYHYTSLEVAIEYILPKMEMRMSPLHLVNDPFEYKSNVDLIFVTSSGNLKMMTPSILDIYEKELIEFKNNYIKILCFSQDNTMKIEELKNSSNIDLGRGYGLPRMWAQYANHHRGVCLVFDYDILLKECKGLYYDDIVCDSIVYRDEYDLENDPYSLECNHFEVKTIQEYVREHLIKQKNQILYSKKEDWKDESEFRISLIDTDLGYKYLSCRKSLVGIVLGDRFPMEYLQCLKEYASIEIGKINWNYYNTNVTKLSIP